MGIDACVAFFKNLPRTGEQALVFAIEFGEDIPPAFQAAAILLGGGMLFVDNDSLCGDCLGTRAGVCKFAILVGE